MKIDQNIKDAIKASVGIFAVIVLIVACIMIYDAVTYNEVEEISGFLTYALILHDDLDENEIRDNIHNLIGNISSNQIENPEIIDSALVRESSLIRHYKERYYILISPTDEMYALKKSLIEEGRLFLSSYMYLKEAWESKKNDDNNAYLSNVEKTIQYLDDSMNLRIQNRAELDEWKIKFEAELLN
ncbi:hypothetical protein ACFLYB_06920 [Chloroflexota bacterium]